MFGNLYIFIGAVLVALLLGATGGYVKGRESVMERAIRAEAAKSVIDGQIDLIRQEQKKTEDELKTANAKAADIRVVTVERTREIQAAPIAPGCQPAMNFMRDNLDKIRNERREARLASH